MRPSPAKKTRQKAAMMTIVSTRDMESHFSNEEAGIMSHDEPLFFSVRLPYMVEGAIITTTAAPTARKPKCTPTLVPDICPSSMSEKSCCMMKMMTGARAARMSVSPNRFHARRQSKEK